MVHEFDSLIEYAKATWRDRELIRYRMAIQDAGEVLGVSKQRVSQMVDEAKLDAVRIKLGSSHKLCYVDPREVKALAAGDSA